MNLDKEIIKTFTICVVIKVTDINWWVIERLNLLIKRYEPKPNILIIDLGSEYKYKKEIEKIISNEQNVEYYYTETNKTFNLAYGRNLAYKNAKTEILCFMDIDFTFYSNFFIDLYKHCKLTNMVNDSNGFLLLPIYHLTKKATEEFFKLDNINKDNLLYKISINSISNKFGDICEFITCYSNCLIISKKCFKISGGYDTNFRGYGNEDFEYLTRLGLITNSGILPKCLSKNIYGPTSLSYFSKHKFVGFRKYLETLTTKSELQGYKVFHLYHDKPSQKGYWTSTYDRKRTRLVTILNSYDKNRTLAFTKNYLTTHSKVFIDIKKYQLNSLNFLWKTLKLNNLDICLTKETQEYSHLTNNVVITDRLYSKIQLTNNLTYCYLCNSILQNFAILNINLRTNSIIINNYADDFEFNNLSNNQLNNDYLKSSATLFKSYNTNIDKDVIYVEIPYLLFSKYKKYLQTLIKKENEKLVIIRLCFNYHHKNRFFKFIKNKNLWVFASTLSPVSIMNKNWRIFSIVDLNTKIYCQKEQMDILQELDFDNDIINSNINKENTNLSLQKSAFISNWQMFIPICKKSFFDENSYIAKKFFIGSSLKEYQIFINKLITKFSKNILTFVKKINTN